MSSNAQCGKSIIWGGNAAPFLLPPPLEHGIINIKYTDGRGRLNLTKADNVLRQEGTEDERMFPEKSEKWTECKIKADHCCRPAVYKCRAYDRGSQGAGLCRLVCQDGLSAVCDDCGTDVGDLPFFSVRGRTIYTDRGIFCVACGTCSKTDPRVVSRASCLLEFYGSSYSGDPCVSLCVMLRDQLSENVVFRGGADCDIFLQCGGIGRDLSLAD